MTLPRTHYNYFRDYDSAIGRYVESDPIGLDGGVNTFVYADSVPTEEIDADGLQAVRPQPGGGSSSRGGWSPRLAGPFHRGHAR